MPAVIDGMEEILKEFLAESSEGLDRVETDLVELDQHPTALERLPEVFRAIHTIKGSSGMLGYSKLESIAHAGEALLAGLRDGKLQPSPGLITGLLAMVDTLRGLLHTIERTGGEGSEDLVAVVRSLEDLLRNPGVPNLQPMRRSEPAEGQPVEENPASGTIRVDVFLLDQLLELTGELVLVRNQLARLAGSQTDGALLSAVQRLKRTAGDLQEAVMKARLQPVGSVWNKFPRVARDLALSCGKQVTVRMEGSDTELDRAMIEAVRDPLTHILRNAIDHGIEAPEQRSRAGKPAAGQLHFHARHREGRVQVEISDDGAGIDLDRVRRRAVQLGLLSREQGLKTDKKQLINLVFTPGFSTSEKVSNISGRGVGLDVVRTNVEKIGGSVELESTLGTGTTVRITIPLTLAILPVLIVGSAGRRFAVPQSSLVEVVRLDDGRQTGGLEHFCGAAVLRLHNSLLPICFLDSVLRLASSGPAGAYVLVMQLDDGQYGVVVDEVHEFEEIVVKPLDQQVNAAGCFAGASILGDGEIVPILDVAGVERTAGIIAVRRAENDSTTGHAAQIPAEWLVFRGGKESRYALPLTAVARLEEIPVERIEHLSGREVVQYRDEILPLFHLSELLDEPEQEQAVRQVAVLRESGEAAGLVIGRIEDIVEGVVEFRGASCTDLLAGSAIIGGKVADVLNVKAILTQAKKYVTGRRCDGTTKP